MIAGGGELKQHSGTNKLLVSMRFAFQSCLTVSPDEVDSASSRDSNSVTSSLKRPSEGHASHTSSSIKSSSCACQILCGHLLD
jgi:hypothetical protein